MNFFETYKEISEVKERRTLRKKIVEACKIEVFTFYGWFRRGDVPKWHHKTIADILDKKQEELFPNN